MNKKTNLQIIESIRSIIDSTEAEVSYYIDRHVDEKSWFTKKRKEVITVNITLTKEL